jgi:predicted Zn-dependent protease
MVDCARVPQLLGEKLLDVGKPSTKIERPPEIVKDAIDSARNAGAERVAGSLISETTKLTQRSSGGPSGSCKGTSHNLNVRAFTDGESTGQFATAAMG